MATSTDDDLKTEVSVPGVVILESRVAHSGHGGHLTHTDAIMMTSPPPIMSTHAHTLPSSQVCVLVLCIYFTRLYFVVTLYIKFLIYTDAIE